ncbi:Uncharacterised protein [Mycobacteroides abscessus subsp. massiliense]|nr:Uncharacterised protein [Mycobacteroides abscessus subsp. massiliense]
MIRGTVTFGAPANIAAGLDQATNDTARRSGPCSHHGHELINGQPVGARSGLALLLNLLILLVLSILRLRLLVLRLLRLLLSLLGLLGRVLLRCLIIRVRFTGPLGVGRCGLIVRDLGPMGRLIPALLRLLGALLPRNLLCARRSRVIDADTRVLIQRWLIVTALVIRH